MATTDPGIPYNMDLERRRADTFPLRLKLKDKTTGTAINITDFTFRWVCDSRKEPDDDSTKVFDVAGVVDDGLNGEVSFSPSLVDVNHVGVYFHEIEWTDTANKVRTIVEGKLTFKQDRAKE